MDILTRLRNDGAVVFGTETGSVLFEPESLQIFALSRKAAGVISRLLEGEPVDRVATQFQSDVQSISKLMEALGSQIEAARPPRINVAPALAPGASLPKLVLMVNNFCNLKCTYCYEHKTVFDKPAHSMPIETARRALDSFFEAFSEIRTLMFIGGEPTLNLDVLEFACEHAYDVASRSGRVPPSVCMISNGVKLTADAIALAKKYSIQVTFSLDGPRVVNDLVRIRHDNTGSYEDVARNIRTFSAAMPGKVGLECTVTKAHATAGVTISDLLRFTASEIGVKQPHIVTAGLPPNHPLDPCADGGGRLVAEYRSAAKHSIDGLLEGMRLHGSFTATTGSLDTVSSMFEGLLRREGFINMCPAGISQLVVDAFGDVYPCWMFAGMQQYRMGNILQDAIFNTVADRVLDRIRRNSKNANPTCRECYARNLCSACIGNNQNGTGAIETMTAPFCDSVRETLKTVIVTIGEKKADAPTWNALCAAAATATGGLRSGPTC